MEKYNYIVTVSKFSFFDVKLMKLLLFYDDCNDHVLDDITASVSSDWGVPSIFVVKDPETYPLPNRIEMRWTTPEGKCYEIAVPLDQAKAEEIWGKQEQVFPDKPFKQYVIGIAPHASVAIWLCNDEKSVLLHWLQAEEKPLTVQEIYTRVLNPEMEKQANTIMPPKKLQSNMRQHHYRFVPLEEYFDSEGWQKYSVDDGFYEAIELDGVEVKRLDGTFDYTDCDDVLRYHEAGKPCRITVRWREGDASFFAHFWLDEAETTFFSSQANLFP